MDKSTAQIKIEKLSKELHKHNYNYYVLSQPTITDYQFDIMLKELMQLEEQFPEFIDEHSPTKRVGGTITKEFETVNHKYRMLSLSNSYSQEDLIDFEKRIQKLIEEEEIRARELKIKIE